MAHIKCRYSVPVCGYTGERVYNDEMWFCDSSCPWDECNYQGDPESKCINKPCIYKRHADGEFETTVKAYQYENAELKLKGRKYFGSEILYLEIDGRVLVKED